MPRPALRVPSGPPLRERLVPLLVRARAFALVVLVRLRAVLGRRIPAGPAVAVRLGAGLLGAAVVVAFGSILYGHLTTAAAFAIDALEVTGTRRLGRAEVLEAATLKLGDNVFARGPAEVRERLLRHPWILDAEVTRELPSRFRIAVRERVPVALLVVEACGPPARADDDPGCEEPSSLHLVSAEGVLFKRVGGKDPADLPVITGLTKQRYVEDPELERRVLADALALMRQYRAAGLADAYPIGEIHLEANDGLSLYVGDDLTYVRLGAPPFERKLRQLQRVIERLERERARAEYVYLDNTQHPDRVAVRLK